MPSIMGIDSNGTSHATPGDEKRSIDVPVLIVGAGPCGLLLAYLLSKFNVRSLVIEKYPQRLGAPKAHALSPRSLEICRQFGLDTREIRKLGTQRADAYWVNFVTTLSGERVGYLPYERMDPETLDSTPEMIHNIPQPVFEKFVADNLLGNPLVELKKSIAFVSLSQDGEVVTSTLEERDSKKQYQIRSRHVVACDGAKSQVRKSLGIECEGEDSYETMMTIHFKADLRPVVGEHVGMLHWVMDPGASGFIIGYDLSGNQVLIVNFDSEKNPASSWNEAMCRNAVIGAVGKEIPLEILSFRPWVLSRKVAKKYQQGNVFLCGDAAHSFPPTGGLGLNAGIADVHNIAFKIAAVEKGTASPKLLETYGAERRHIAEVCSTQSVKNGKKIFSFLKMLGTAGIDDVDEARRNLLKTVHDPSKQEMIQSHVEAQREHFDNLEIHIGYVYGSDETPPHASYYTPKFKPGARLPHAWIRPLQRFPQINPIDTSYVKELSATDISSRRFSTLDLCAPDAFTLIVRSRSTWEEKFKSIEQLAATKWNTKVNLYAADTDFDIVFEEQRELFVDGAKLDVGGGMLVRPDQHILVMLTGETGVEDLVNTLGGFLGRL